MSGESTPIDEDSAHEALLTEYENHRAEIRLIMELHDKLFIRSATVIGALIGYSFYRAENKILLTIVPFALGFFLIRHVSLSHGMARIATHVREIESTIDVEGFDWETRFGVTSKDAEAYDVIPLVSLYLLVSILYFTSVVVALSVTQGRSMTFLKVEIDMIFLAAAYSIFSILLTGVIGSNLLAIRRRRREFIGEDEASESILDINPYKNTISLLRWIRKRLNW